MAHTPETRLKISESMRGNKNAEKDELSLEGAIKMLEIAVELSQQDENLYFIGQVCKKLGTNRHQLSYLIDDKFPEELKELGKSLWGNLETNLIEAVAEKRISDKVLMPTLKAFYGKTWNVADKKEVTTDTKTTFVFEEKILIPQGKTVNYIDITPKPKQLSEYEEDIDEIDSF